jgi:hypothetical protein
MLWMVQPRQERQSTFTSRAFLIMKSLRPVKVINLMLVCLIAQKSRDNSLVLLNESEFRTRFPMSDHHSDGRALCMRHVRSVVELCGGSSFIEEYSSSKQRASSVPV